MMLKSKRHSVGVIAALAWCAVLVFLAGCGGGGGGSSSDGGVTPTNPSTPDTTAPVIAIAYPADNAEFTANALPAYVQLTYSDAGGLDLSTLNVSLTLNGRTIDLTGLFATDSVQNAATTRTDAAQANPLYRTAITRFMRSDTGFASATGTATIPRGTASAMSLECLDDTGRIALWSTGLSSAYVLPAGGAFQAAEVSLGFTPVTAAAADGVIFAGKNGFGQLFAINADTGSVSNIITLPDEPAHLAYHPATRKMYISYENTGMLQVSRLDTALGIVDQTIPLAYAPVLIGARRGDTAEGVFVVGATAGQFRMFLYDSNGVQGQAAALGLTQPSALSFDAASGNVYLSRFDTGKLTRAEPTGATTDISVGANPRGVFADGAGRVFAINSGSKSISFVLGTNVAGTAVFDAPPLAGLADCGSDYTYLVQDIWSLDTQTPGTLTATIKDTSGNTGTASITLQFSPEPVVPVRIAGN
jgi:hypothetical protein